MGQPVPTAAFRPVTAGGAQAAGPAAQPAPRAGGFPTQLALLLLASGAAALGGGSLLLRRGKKP